MKNHLLENQNKLLQLTLLSIRDLYNITAMKKAELLTTEITALSHDGRGIGRDLQGKTVFIDGALPGEQVTCEITQKKRRFNVARAVSIDSPAADRVTPQCPHFLLCGGCSNQHLSEQAQLTAKQSSLLEQLEHFGQTRPENILPPITGPQWGYRTKARLGVRYVHKKDKVLVGFREKHSNFIAELQECSILHPLIANLIQPLQSFIRNLDSYQDIPQLEVAVGGEQLAIIVRHLQALSTTDREAWIAFATEHSFACYLQPAGPDSITKLWPADNNQRLYYQLPAYDLNFAFHPSDFTQVNTAINQKMIAQALHLLDLQATDTVLDLFCGLGNFSLPMAQVAHKVTGIEGAQSMVKRAYENAGANSINNVDFYPADLTEDQSHIPWAKVKYHKVLLDPPRSGALAVLPWLAQIKPQKILYVSCNPATLARDCGELVNKYGYKLSNIGIMDMFPHTQHVEAMALLELN